jgi:hypothetical protein
MASSLIDSVAGTSGAGRVLAERLGLTIIGIEGHDLKCGCPFCPSSDAGRLHRDSGVYFCYSCQRALSALDLTKVVLNDQAAAVKLMVEVGLFQPYMSTGNGHAGPTSPAEILDTIARKKGCTAAGFLAYGAEVKGKVVVFPMHGPDGKRCSTFTLDLSGGKGLYAKGKPTGLFLPNRLPQPGETWAIVEGVKDAAALHSLGILAAGLPTNRMNTKFAPLFKDAKIVIVPDADTAGVQGASATAAVLRGVAQSVKVARLPAEHKDGGGADVRDVLREQGPDAIHQAIAEARPVGDTGAENKPLRFHRLTCAELDAGKYDLEYLIDGALVAGQPCILAGGKKSLKTSIMIDLGISLAVGGWFLGKLRVNRSCRVGIMTGESGLATIQETARRIAAAAGYSLPEIDGLVFSEELPQFGNQAHEEALREFITTDRLEVLAVDPAYMCLPDVDHANLFQVGERLRGVSKVCQETGALLLLAHHTRKGGKADPFSPPELEDIAWSGFQEFCRQWLLVARRELYQPGTGEHRLWLSVGGSAGHSDLWALDISEGTRATPGGRFWTVNAMRPDDARQAITDRKEATKLAERDERLQRDKQTVCNAMVKFPTGESKTVIRDSSGLNTSRFGPAFSALLADGVAVPCEVFKGNRKTAFEGYKLREGNPHE